VVGLGGDVVDDEVVDVHHVEVDLVFLHLDVRRVVIVVNYPEELLLVLLSTFLCSCWTFRLVFFILQVDFIFRQEFVISFACILNYQPIIFFITTQNQGVLLLLILLVEHVHCS
jgi:hypothetical protein